MSFYTTQSLENGRNLETEHMCSDPAGGGDTAHVFETSKGSTKLNVAATVHVTIMRITSKFRTHR